MKNPEIGRNKLLQMSESEIKLKIIRLIDSQNGETLKELYELILAKLYGKNKEESSFSPIEEGYKAMSEDEEREEEAFEWIEGTLNSEELRRKEERYGGSILIHQSVSK
jgi:hypothetical protein